MKKNLLIATSELHKRTLYTPYLIIHLMFEHDSPDRWQLMLRWLRSESGIDWYAQLDSSIYYRQGQSIIGDIKPRKWSEVLFTIKSLYQH